jgi:O-acetyl-ADP-ribose deacetylase (regulator of RNase III)
VYRDGNHGEPELLASAYRRSLEVAREHGLESVAFPAISTGVYGYPMDEAARVGLGTIAQFLKARGTPKLARMVLFDEYALAAHERALVAIAANGA